VFRALEAGEVGPRGDTYDRIRKTFGWPRSFSYAQLVDASSLTLEMRDALLRYLAATSKERARVIGELAARNRGMADVLIDLEADYDLGSDSRSSCSGATLQA
jgi:hypothetical protein